MSARRSCSPLNSFNPRSREGSDLFFAISVFTFTRFNPRSREGNDSSNPQQAVEDASFNPRSREGNDVGMGGVFLRRALFQSTLP